MAPVPERVLRQFTQSSHPWPLRSEAGPWCGCCLHITRAGDDAPRHVPAAYMWVTMVGNRFRLCVSCCADWRENAAADHDLLPARICSL